MPLVRPQLTPTPSRVEYGGVEFVPFISASEMERAETEWAEAVWRDFEHGTPPILLSIEQGGRIPRDHLAVKLGELGMTDFDTDEITVGRPDDNPSSPLIIIDEPKLDIAGRNVIAVDNLYNTGKSSNELRSILGKRKPECLVFAVMISKDKPLGTGQEKPLPEYIATHVDDVYILGRGISYESHAASRLHDGIMVRDGDYTPPSAAAYL